MKVHNIIIKHKYFEPIREGKINLLIILKFKNVIILYLIKYILIISLPAEEAKEVTSTAQPVRRWMPQELMDNTCRH